MIYFSEYVQWFFLPLKLYYISDSPQENLVLIIEESRSDILNSLFCFQMIRYEGPNAILTALSCLHNTWVFIYLLQPHIWSLLHMRDMQSNITVAQGHAIPRHCNKL